MICKLKRWGNSLGLIIPSEEAKELDLRENQQVAVEITKKDNPLKDLFGFTKDKKISRKEVEDVRTILESARF